MKNSFSPLQPKILGLICVMGLMLAGFSQVFARASLSQLQKEPLSLQVPVGRQAWSTSCGEAVIAMVYNYIYPNAPITEAEVIEYAAANGYYTVDEFPYTSPANMVRIAKNYGKEISSGRVMNSSQGLALLTQKLRKGEPVIIDVLSDFEDPASEAHFIVATGISLDPARDNAIRIHFNDPFTGTQETADWAGDTGVWNASLSNDDPGGSGWWLVISPE
jgi:hypothetical protein